MLKVAIVGVGGISGAHIMGWKNIEDTEIAAICDIRQERLDMYPDYRHYTDFDAMLEGEEIDVLDICLPTYLHADFAIKAMKLGINVLCEKPLSLNSEDVTRVYETAKENNVKFMAAQVIRFWNEYDALKKIYDEKRYGELLSGRVWRLGQMPGWSWDGWMFDENRSGLVPFDLHIHDLDFLVYTFGKPNNVKANRSKRPEQDYIHAVYEFDGFFVSAECAWYAGPHPFVMGYRFQFEKAVVTYEGGKMTVYEVGEKPCDMTGGGNVLGDGIPSGSAYESEIRYFVNCVREGKEPDKIKPHELETVIKILRTL